MWKSSPKNQLRTMARFSKQCYYSMGFLADAAAAWPQTSIGYLLTSGSSGNLKVGRSKGDLYAGAALGFLVIATHFLHDVAASKVPDYDDLVEGQRTKELGICLNKVKTCKKTGEATETRKMAVVRHLRNCFAHYRFEIHVRGTNVHIQLRDYSDNAGTKPTFKAGCKLCTLVNYVEQLFRPAWSAYVAAVGIEV